MKAGTKITPWLRLCAGVVWIWIALSRFDRLSLLDVYNFPNHHRVVPHQGGRVLLPCVVGLLCLAGAALGFLRRNNTSPPAVITLFGRHPD